MNSPENKQTLFILEGEKFEPHILRQMKPLLEEATGSTIRYYKACCDIYSFFNIIDKDEYSDGVLVYLKSISAKDENGKLLFPDDDERVDTVFSSIYLVFDFEPQASLFSKEKIVELCSYFNEETENGKLLINFPMIESIHDVRSLDPKDSLNATADVELENFTNGETYKKEVKEKTIFRNQQTNHPFKKIYIEGIIISFYVNAYRYLYLLGYTPEFFKEDLKTELITLKQVELLENTNKIRVLNMFVLILLNYKEYLDMAIKKLS